MQIIIDTANLSELDINMLAFLAENGEVAETEEAEETPAPAPAKKTAAKKTAAKKPDPEPEAEEEADEPEETEAEDDDAPTMSDAVAAATQLVSSGQAAKVKEALATVGAKRVSEIEEKDIAAFMAALEEA